MEMPLELRLMKVSVIMLVVETLLRFVEDPLAVLTVPMAMNLCMEQEGKGVKTFISVFKINYYSLLHRSKLVIDGGWAEWSDWSSCQSNCKKSRTRKCNNPSPLFGGANCTGDGYAESAGTCYGGDCCPGVGSLPLKEVPILI